MKSLCQFELCIYYHLPFDAFPYPLLILVDCLRLEVTPKIALMLQEATPRQLIACKRFLFLLLTLLTVIFEV